MRAMKRTVSVLLSLMLVLGMATMGIGVASAAETNTVTFTSNIGSGGSVEYVPGTSKQVTVTYNLKTATTVINAQGVLSFDKNVLQVASGQQAASVCPNLNSNLMVNLEKTDGRIPFVASDFANGFDFSGGAVLMTVVFDIIGSGNTNVTLDVSTITGTTQLNSTSANDVTIVEGSQVASGVTLTSTSTADVSPSAVDPSAFIGDMRLNLEGRIGMNFYFVLAPEGVDANKVSFQFIGPDDNAEQNVTVKHSDLKKAVRKGVYYKFYTYYLFAHMMTQNVKVNVLVDNKVVTTATYCVRTWANDHMAEFEAAAPAQATLLKRMLNYGAAVQTQFDMYTDSLANDGLNYAVQRITSDTIQVPSGLNVTPNLSSIGATFTKMSAELKDGTAIRLTISANDIEKFNKNKDITCDGAVLPYLNEILTQQTRVAYLDNVTSMDLDTVYTFTFKNGATYKTSVMSYLKGLLAKNPADSVVNLCSAMYWYNQSANEVFE